MMTKCDGEENNSIGFFLSKTPFEYILVVLLVYVGHVLMEKVHYL
jgi:hypothetical protein